MDKVQLDQDTRISRVAENAMLKLAARLIMVFVVPSSLAIGGAMATWLISTTHENTKALIRQEAKLTSLADVTVPAAVLALTDRINNHEKRLDNIDLYNRAQDKRFEEMQRQVWQHK